MVKGVIAHCDSVSKASEGMAPLREYTVAVIPGDGIGPEITTEAVHVLDEACAAVDIRLAYRWLECSGRRWLETGETITEAEYEVCASADAIFLGALGLMEARHPDGTEAASDVMFRLRFGLDLYASVRPVRSYKGVPTPLRGDPQIDYVVVREGVEGLYASRGGGTNVRGEVATDTVVITRAGTEKVARKAFALAQDRAQKRSEGDRRVPKVTCVDKANVLKSYAFFRQIFDEVAREYPSVTVEHAYVDAMTLYQVARPESFDVVVAENMFGDIISDLSSATVGGLGMAPSADIGDRHAMFQPAHGSAPDIAGLGVANPAAAVLSGGLLLQWIGERNGDAGALEAARVVEQAVGKALSSGQAATRDIGGSVSTEKAGTAIVNEVRGGSRACV